MDIRKAIIPRDKTGEPMSAEFEREYIYFKARFNNFREVSGSAENAVLDREEFAECEAVLCLPDSYTNDNEETPLILSCHGAGPTVCEERSMIGGIPYAFECLKAGYAVLDICGCAPHGLTLGCPEHVFALFKAYKHAIGNYNLTERVLVAGSSMGAQTAINFANTFPAITIALGLFNPGLNLNAVTVGDHICRNPWDRVTANGHPYREKIIEYFRFPSEEWCDKNAVGFDPYRTRSLLNAEGARAVIPPCPVKIWQGADDGTVDPVMSREYIDSIRRAGCFAEYHEIEGVKHSVTRVMREELLIWFNRFV